MIIRILSEKINWKNIKNVLYGIIPVLLSSFWFIPFIFYSTSPGGYADISQNLFSFLDLEII